MEAKAKLAGHAVHPMLVVFPLGLLATSLIFDVLYLATRNLAFGNASYWMIAAGVIGGLAAAAFGLIDWLAIPPNTRAKAIGLWHGLGNVVVLVLFVISWAIRYNAGPSTPTGGAIFLSVMGVVLAVVTGWLGGELVDRLGVGVDTGAHLNSPNSLSGRPASDVDGNYASASAPAAVVATSGRMAGRDAGRTAEGAERREAPDRAPSEQPIDRGPIPPV